MYACKETCDLKRPHPDKRHTTFLTSAIETTLPFYILIRFVAEATKAMKNATFTSESHFENIILYTSASSILLKPEVNSVPKKSRLKQHAGAALFALWR